MHHHSTVEGQREGGKTSDPAVAFGRWAVQFGSYGKLLDGVQIIEREGETQGRGKRATLYFRLARLKRHP